MTREEAIEDIRDNIKPVVGGISLDMAIKALEQQSKIGHWINLEETKYKGQVLPFWSRYECSKCGGHGEGTFNYCPNCGAKMIESEEEDDKQGMD